MNKKTILLIDDEQSFLEPLADALSSEGYRILIARTASEALEILKQEKIDMVTIDIMLDPSEALKDKVDSHKTGLFLCEEISRNYPHIAAFCISVISDMQTIKKIESFGIRFLRKGETPLRTVLNMLRSRLTNVAYSTELDSSSRKRNF